MSSGAIPMIASMIDSVLARYSGSRHEGLTDNVLPTRRISTPAGSVRVYDSGSAKPCVVFVPDGPNVIEHYEYLLGLLSQRLRVICFDMPGFGFSFPEYSYGHSLDQGAGAILGVLDGLGIEKAVLAFSCVNGFYALRTAQMAPERIPALVLSQTPSLAAMHGWGKRAIPRALMIPVAGQILGWLTRRKAARIWYSIALPRTTPVKPFEDKALDALSQGGCFCLASVCQGMWRENVDALAGISTPCTLVWGMKDHSHKYTDPMSLHELIPTAEIIRFEDCGHFPDLEQPERFANLLTERVAMHG